MTTDKARKRAVRTRMTKTGERYAAARRHIVGEAAAPAAAASLTSTAPPAPMLPALPPRVADPGMSEEGITNGTGRGWDDWFRILDAWDGTAHTHPEIARHLREEHDVNGWWAQGVTVGYERARGMRALHETTRGFEVSVSKTVQAAPEALWHSLIDPAGRDAWLEPGLLRRRPGTGVEHRSARFDVVADGSRVLVAFTPKDDGRTSVTITNERLPGSDAIEPARARWRAGLARLAASHAGTPERRGVASPSRRTS